jgi:serine/threonine-protein kinase PRP4
MSFIRISLFTLIVNIFNLVKPDNAIINKGLTNIKVCDFGSAMNVEEVVITADLVSRFYRAPEIFLGMQYDTKIDIWSIGCTLYELYTGKILFPGKHNNEMLKLIQQMKGRIPLKMIKRGQFSNIYFTDSDKFLSLELDSFDKKEYIKEIDIPLNPSKEYLIKGTDDQTISFRDFLDKLLHIDPNKRLSAIEALCHPFIMNIKY